MVRGGGGGGGRDGIELPADKAARSLSQMFSRLGTL